MRERPEFIYSAVLFTLALAVLTVGMVGSDSVLQGNHPLLALFFFLYGLFTIRAGYDHPRIGYVSFDRVSQIASILVLGPLNAAWVNGLASLVFPWTRFRHGMDPRRTVTASLNNAGLMTLMVLISGWLYQFLGGQVPLLRLDLTALALLPLLILSMQAVNELGMAIHFQLRDGVQQLQVSRFVFGLEAGSGIAAVVVAVVLNRLEPAVSALLLLVLSAGMLLLRQFARMRIELEAIVDERTRVLMEKTVELEQLAIRDQLTGLYNRRFADSYLDGRIEEFNRYRREFAIALIDLDLFKRINDQYSHEVGDQVLQRVSQILLDRCRQTDVVARYGGEEFLLCFPEADSVTVADICEQLRHAVSGADWSDLGEDVQVSMSAGVAEMRAGFGRSKLVNAADHKLYEAKNAGRNLVLR